MTAVGAAGRCANRLLRLDAVGPRALEQAQRPPRQRWKSAGPTLVDTRCPPRVRLGRSKTPGLNPVGVRYRVTDSTSMDAWPLEAPQSRRTFKDRSTARGRRAKSHGILRLTGRVAGAAGVPLLDLLSHEASMPAAARVGGVASRTGTCGAIAVAVRCAEASAARRRAGRLEVGPVLGRRNRLKASCFLKVSLQRLGECLRRRAAKSFKNCTLGGLAEADGDPLGVEQ